MVYYPQSVPPGQVGESHCSAVWTSGAQHGTLYRPPKGLFIWGAVALVKKKFLQPLILHFLAFPFLCANVAGERALPFHFPFGEMNVHWSPAGKAAAVSFTKFVWQKNLPWIWGLPSPTSPWPMSGVMSQILPFALCTFGCFVL